MQVGPWRFKLLKPLLVNYDENISAELKSIEELILEWLEPNKYYFVSKSLHPKSRYQKATDIVKPAENRLQWL